MALHWHLIATGKLKDRSLETLESSYLKRMVRPKLMIHEVKAKAENPELESSLVLKKHQDICPTAPLILLSEHGKNYSSKELASWIEKKNSLHNELVFVIAGAQGHGEAILQEKHEKLSLSPLTFPHKIARLLLVEQLYRVQSILQGHPYHN